MRACSFTLILLCLFQRATAADGDQVICERVDEIVRVEIESGQWARIYFFRDGRRLATRFEQDDMLWTTIDGRFALVWSDFGQAQRIVEADSLWLLSGPCDPFEDDPQAAWWNQNRNMRDLKQR